MKPHNPVLLCSALFVLAGVSQTIPEPGKLAGARVTAELGNGVVAEAVKKDSVAARAGIQEGDILLRWTRSDARGEIESPFDLSWIEIEQAPRGAVTIEGLRATETRVWELSPSNWGIRARPNLSQDLLSTYLEGQKLATAGKLQDAAERWRAAAGKVRTQSSWLGAWFLLHVAELFANDRQWKEADGAYEAAIEQSAAAEPEIKAQLLKAWSVTFERRDDWANAEKHYQEAAEESKKRSSQSLMLAGILDKIGSTAWQRRDSAKAETCYFQALEIQQRLAPGSLDLAVSLSGLGLAAWSRGDLTHAEAYLRQAWAIRARLDPGSLDVARSLNNLAIVFYARGDLEKQEDYYRQALAIYERLDPGSLDAARSINNLALVFYKRGDLVTAEEYFRQALAIKEKLVPNSLDVASSLNNLGSVARERGDLVTSKEYFRQALAIKEKLAPDSLDTAASLNNMGQTVRDLGDLESAVEFYGRALAIHEKLAPGGLDAATILNNLGVMFRKRGDLAKAEDYQRRALAVREKLAPGSLDAAESLAGLGDIARDRGDLAKAEEYYRQGLAIWAELAPQHEHYADALASLAGIMMRKQQVGPATLLFEQAVNVLESQMGRLGGGEEVRADFRAQHAAYYRDYIDLLIRQNQQAQAFRVLERSRARTLLEILGSGSVKITKAMTPAERKREDELLSHLVSLNRQLGIEKAARKPDEGHVAELKSGLEKTRLEYSDFRTALYVAHPELRAQRGQIQPISLGETASLLPDNRTAILEFLVADEKTYLFVLTRRKGNAVGPELNIYTIDIKAKELGQEAEEFRQQLSSRDLQFGASATNLFNLLVRPARAELAGVTSLLVVPDGPLWNLPFQALQPQTGHYLLESYALSYAPSVTVLREMSDLRMRSKGTPATAAPQTLLAMGNPALAAATSERAKLTYRDEKLAPLPEAANEVKALESLYGRQQSHVFVGAEAAEDRFKAQAGEFRILHLATHGLLNDASPMYSHLLLSPGEPNSKQDGLLEAWEIMDLDLHADLAVLSACETARGRITSGEGVIGLTWAFFVAGVPTTVVSQWKVESTSTAELMLAFHRARKATDVAGASPFRTARALRTAEIQLLHNPKFSHPFYWAGFIVMGDPK